MPVQIFHGRQASMTSASAHWADPQPSVGHPAGASAPLVLHSDPTRLFGGPPGQLWETKRAKRLVIHVIADFWATTKFCLNLNAGITTGSRTTNIACDEAF